TLDWSYRLLSPELQQLLARLSVFRGGWSLTAATAIAECGIGEPPGADPGLVGPDNPHSSFRNPQSAFEGWDLLDQLTQLRRCSLVIAEEVTVPGAGDGPASPEMRFRMLDTVREYAGQQVAPGDAESLQRRHRDWFLALAEESETQLFGPDRTAWLQRL